MKNWSAPAVTLHRSRPGRRQNDQGEQEEKQVDYSHLDIVAEVERIIGRSLKRHTRTTGKYNCQCPFPDCTSKNDAFTVWDRPILEERGSGRREVHFWCGRCNRTGSLISLIRQYREATTGEQMSWSDAARELRIDPRTWRAVDAESGQREAGPSRKAYLRRQQAEQARQAEQAEVDMLSAWYHRARQWLAAGQIVLKDGRRIALDTARAYLQERGFTLDQAARLGLAYIPTVKELPEIAEEKTLAPWRGRILFPLDGPRSARGYAGRSLWKWEPGMTAEQHKKLLEVDGKNRVPRYYKTRQQAFYGYDLACQVRTLVCVEGEFDAASIRLALADRPDIAAVAFGKNFSARLIPANVLNVLLALDGDQAGLEAIERQAEELEARGVAVEIARPPAKDWNDYHQVAGLDAIRAAIAGQDALQPSTNIDSQPCIEPPGYENGDVCLLCGQQVEESEGAFMVDDLGNLYCISCWERQQVQVPTETASDQGADARAARCLARVQIFEGEMRGGPVWPEPVSIRLLPAGMTSAEYIDRWTAGERPGRLLTTTTEPGDQAAPASEFSFSAHRCARHGRALRYSDEQGGRYCDHVACWNRYRLIRAGAARGYPALAGVIDPRDYLADESKPPLYYAAGVPIFPARSARRLPLIAAGAEAWREFVRERDYQDIDRALKALEQKAET
jgi:hypothetical protein